MPNTKNAAIIINFLGRRPTSVHENLASTGLRLLSYGDYCIAEWLITDDGDAVLLVRDWEKAPSSTTSKQRNQLMNIAREVNQDFALSLKAARGEDWQGER